jgi:predicted secreted protein
VKLRFLEDLEGWSFLIGAGGVPRTRANAEAPADAAGPVPVDDPEMLRMAEALLVA